MPIAAASAATSQSEPDAELIALAHEFCRLECAWHDAINAAPDTQPGEEEADARAEELYRKPQRKAANLIVDLRASSLLGVRAKARCAVMFGAHSYDAAAPYIGDRILSSLMTDLVGFVIPDEFWAEDEMRRRFEAGEVA